MSAVVTQPKPGETRGLPDGPEIFAPEFGCKVGTFTQRRGDLETRKLFENLPCVMYHVPFNKRGPYKPEHLANFDAAKEYKTDHIGYVLCTAANKNAINEFTKFCRRRAENRQPYCGAHGGKLHPLDKRDVKPVDPATLTRWEQLEIGYISVDDLDDEELRRGQCRRADGDFPQRTKQIPRQIYDKMVNRLFERAQEMFRQNLFTAVETLGTIVEGDAYEPADRIKAANIIIDRVLGKSVEKVDLTVEQKPYERILKGVNFSESREEARLRRENATTAEGLDEDDWIEGEIDETWTPESPAPLAITQTTGIAAAPATSSTPPSGQKEDTPAATKAEVAKESAQSLKDKIKASRNRRFAARTHGLPTTADIPYTRVVAYDNLKGALPDDLELAPGCIRVQYISPDNIETPSTVKAKETRRRNADR